MDGAEMHSECRNANHMSWLLLPPSSPLSMNFTSALEPDWPEPSSELLQGFPLPSDFRSGEGGEQLGPGIEVKW